MSVKGSPAWKCFHRENTLLATGGEYLVRGPKLGIFVCLVLFYAFFEILSAFAEWHRGIFWFNPYMQISAFSLTLELSGYWRNHVNYILALNALLLLCEEPTAATMVFGVKYAIYHSNSSFLLFIILFRYSFQISRNEKYYVHGKIFDTINLAFTISYILKIKSRFT